MCDLANTNPEEVTNKDEDVQDKINIVSSNSDDVKLDVKPSLIGESVICSLCKKEVPKLIIFEHTYHHMFTGRKMYPCHVCGKIFAEHCQLITHLTIHTGEKPFECDQCEKTFRLGVSLKNHIKMHHTKTSYESCDQCDDTFSYKRGLLNHQRKVHGKETGYICITCELVYNRKGTEQSYERRCVF